MVGISGAIAARPEWQKARILSLPARCSGSVVLNVSIDQATFPATVSWMAGAPPL